MDRAISPATRLQRRRRTWLLAGLGLLGGILVLVALRGVIQPSLKRQDILTAPTEVGDVEASLTATGFVIPGREAVITSPIQSTVRRVAVAVGSAVRPGQTILELDKELTSSELARLQDAQLQNRNKSTQLHLTLERALNDLRSQEQVQEVKIRSLESTLRDEESLLNIGSGTAESVRQAELTLRLARLEQQRLRGQIRNQRRANAADARELGFTVQIQARSIAELARKLGQADISARQPGVLTWVNEDLGATVQPGDVLVRVADLSSFRVRATISDAYADALHVGDAVVIRANTTDLRGTISTVSPAVEKGVVTFYARLSEDHHPALRSNLRVDVFVVTKAHKQVLRVKNGPFYQGGQEQAVFVVQGDQATRRTVRFGDSNFDFVQIVSGLRAGEEVILSDTKAYADTPELTIKP
ncbi:efflux transporter, RND family, MFP subunit [Hymenobacter roseosalivarius DSM 11622]|uniref:Efflux transporter, RND family, MFP subunit n=1 Tax=Hymenobacter roseosalivarius DSM 11622 TaxID=645990 RepID=A0A1W1V3U3_9BACT|nr:HlyD family efflux transporter periplasmic adaptor subunit [Hymenobacter roseosalivarius]SMB88002.1 efflux transporter, RND family, MFP subunit [Hymenobacter roseosalivarius DSM 11622]